MNKEQFKKSTHKSEIQEMVQMCQALRVQDNIDISFGDFIQQSKALSLDALMQDLGIDPSQTTISNIVSTQDLNVRWLIPEIIRQALSLGYQKSPIWPNLVAAEENIKNPSITTPWINMADATPKKVGEGETIPLGDFTIGSKQAKVYKIGRGIKMTYEVVNYVSLNVAGLFFKDMGTKLGMGLDTLAILTLINGEQANGSESAPLIGVTTPGTVTYADLLRIWLRMSRIGRAPQLIIGGEAVALTTLDMAEFKTPMGSGSTRATLNLKTPIPSAADYYIHGSMPATSQLIVDAKAALIKYNVQPLMVESEKIVSNQTDAFYATLTTGFSTAFRDARILLDSSLNITTNGFPSYMDVDSLENVIMD